MLQPMRAIFFCTFLKCSIDFHFFPLQASSLPLKPKNKLQPISASTLIPSENIGRYKANIRIANGTPENKPQSGGIRNAAQFHPFISFGTTDFLSPELLVLDTGGIG